jgi:hypothetical protein
MNGAIHSLETMSTCDAGYLQVAIHREGCYCVGIKPKTLGMDEAAANLIT